jgi:hypothetical protein
MTAHTVNDGLDASGGPPARLEWWEWAAAAAAIVAPAWLLFEPGANFYYDWHNHQWLVGYFGEYVRVHLAFPETLGAAGAVGMPQPVFYGFLLYPLLGLLAAAVGASWAIRLGVILTLAAEFFSVYCAGRLLSRHRGLALAIAAAVTWSVHGLTNLYNRAALTEFFAVALLNAAVACGVCALAGGAKPRGRTTAAWLAVLLAVLTVGAHPTTGLVGCGLVVVLAAIGWRELGRFGAAGVTARRWAVVAAALGVVAVSPWVYANLYWQGELRVVGKYHSFSFSVERIDAPWARFSPLPPDVFRADGGLPGETPYVEAPLQMTLLLLTGWNLVQLWRARGAGQAGGAGAAGAWRWLAVAGGLWFAGMLALSISPAAAACFRFLAPYVQFATRFVSHANLGLLILALATAGLVAATGGCTRRGRGTAVLAGALLVLAGAALVLKLRHGATVRERGGEPQYAWRGERAALVTKGKADAAGDYAVLKRLPQLVPAIAAAAVRVELPVGTQGGEFGRVGEARLQLPETAWIVTNVVAFPWNRVTVDGRDVPVAARAAQEHRLALRLPAGEHRIAWRWAPDPVWRGLRMAGGGAVVLLLLGAAGLAARRALTARLVDRIACRRRKSGEPEDFP